VPAARATALLEICVDGFPCLVVAEQGCGDCHTNSVDAAPQVPYLSAQHPGYLLKQMADFRDGRRAAAGAVALHQTRLAMEDAKLAEIAAYLGALERQ